MAVSGLIALRIQTHDMRRLPRAHIHIHRKAAECPLLQTGLSSCLLQSEISFLRDGVLFSPEIDWSALASRVPFLKSWCGSPEQSHSSFISTLTRSASSRRARIVSTSARMRDSGTPEAGGPRRRVRRVGSVGGLQGEGREVGRVEGRHARLASASRRRLMRGQGSRHHPLLFYSFHCLFPLPWSHLSLLAPFPAGPGPRPRTLRSSGHDEVEHRHQKSCPHSQPLPIPPSLRTPSSPFRTTFSPSLPTLPPRTLRSSGHDEVEHRHREVLPAQTVVPRRRNHLQGMTGGSVVHMGGVTCRRQGEDVCHSNE
jgi:hypothetical protein